MDASKPGAKRRRASIDPIERVNRKTDDVFIREHLLARDGSGAETGVGGRDAPEGDWAQWTHPRTRERYWLSLARTANLNPRDLKACFDLIEETSRKDYEPSTIGWKPSTKLAEMKSPDLRYLLVKNAAGALCGFTSMMPTYEDGRPVVYCYEIHLKPELQGTGMGRTLMGFLENVAASAPPITKVMLTCFLSNQRALKFYEALGFAPDEVSPGPRKLRSGTVFVPDYVIMSKVVAPARAHAAPGPMERG